MAPKINRTDPFILLFNREMPKTIRVDRKPISKEINYGPTLSKFFKELKVTKLKKEVDDDIPVGAGVGLFIGREETKMMAEYVVTDDESDAESMKREKLRKRKFVFDAIVEMDSDLELSDDE